MRVFSTLVSWFTLRIVLTKFHPIREDGGKNLSINTSTSLSTEAPFGNSGTERFRLYINKYSVLLITATSIERIYNSRLGGHNSARVHHSR